MIVGTNTEFNVFQANTVYNQLKKVSKVDVDLSDSLHFFFPRGEKQKWVVNLSSENMMCRRGGSNISDIVKNK